MNPPWTMHNIKLNPIDNHRMAFGRLTLNRKKDTWQVDFTGFTTAPITGELWMVGDGAQQVFDMAAKSGNLAYHRNVTAPKWDSFIYTARSVVVATSKKLLMVGDMPGREPLNEMAIQTMIMAARREGKPIVEVKPSFKQTLEAEKNAKPNISEALAKQETLVAEAKKEDVSPEAPPVVIIPKQDGTDKKISIEKPKFDRITAEKTVTLEPDSNKTEVASQIRKKIEGVPPEKVTIIDLKADRAGNEVEKKRVRKVADLSEKISQSHEPAAETASVEEKQNKSAKVASLSIQKAAEKLEQAAAKSEEELQKGETVKRILTREPMERVMPPVKELKLPPQKEARPAKLLPINWDIEHIKEALKAPSVRAPFAGTFNGSKFVRVEVAKAMGFNHIMVGEVPLGKLPVYMLCIPGSAARPPAGLPKFNRWIPSRGGGGYWVKYLTPAPNKPSGRHH